MITAMAVVSVLLPERVLLARPELAEGPGARAAIVGDGDRTADGEVGADSGERFQNLVRRIVQAKREGADDDDQPDADRQTERGER
jgi:hypothetical protein